MNKLGYVRFVNRYLLKKYPVELTFFVTSQCNFKCKHCFNWKHKKNEEELKLEEIKRVTETTPNFIRLLISGGEPFLRKDLADICYYFYKNCKVKHISIPTNASMPDRTVKITEEILKNCPNSFVNTSLSLDALGDKRDNFVGINNSFLKFEETFFKLKCLKEHYKNFVLTVITTQTKSNEKDLIKIYKYATKKLKVDNFGFNMVRGNVREPKELRINLNKYAKMAEMMRKDSRKNKGFDFPFVTLFLAKKSLLYKIVLKVLKENKYLMPCYAGRLRCVIDPTGNVYPCETLMQKGDRFNMGNLKNFDYNFKRLWNGKKAQEIRKWIKETKCFCTHECDLTINILFNPMLLPKLLKELKDVA